MRGGKINSLGAGRTRHRLGTQLFSTHCELDGSASGRSTAYYIKIQVDHLEYNGKMEKTRQKLRFTEINCICALSNSSTRVSSALKLPSAKPDRRKQNTPVKKPKRAWKSAKGG